MSKTRVVTKVCAREVDLLEDNHVRIAFKKENVLGSGSFGLVHGIQLLRVIHVDAEGEDKCVAGKKRMAMKTIIARGKESRELNVLKCLSHAYIVKLRYYFYSKGPEGKTLLNLLFDSWPTSVYQQILKLELEGSSWEGASLASCGLCLLQGLEYLHNKNIGHRDIKPRNLLLDSSMTQLAICDLGSACQVGHGEPLTPYICSRFYRAPELLMSSSFYDVQVDMWSVGCVLAEMASLKPLFSGSDSAEMLCEIVDLLGVPSMTQLQDMKVGDSDLCQSIQLLESGLLNSGEDSIKHRFRKMWLAHYPGLDEVCCKLIQYSPSNRPSAANLQQEDFFFIKRLIRKHLTNS